MAVYFNENDPFAANWLVSLFPEATVDDRNICDVEASEVTGFSRAHFFGGIGGWELALRLANWPKEWPVWTGSCPCQPFSCAGAGKGEHDKRHLWPEFRRLIAERSPPVVFGEQVASKLGRRWFAGVRSDLEALGYAVGAAGLPACCVGSPHQRMRIFWLAHSNATERGWWIESRGQHGGAIHATDGGGPGKLADADVPEQGRGQFGLRAEPAINGDALRVADSEHDGRRIDQPQRRPAGRAIDGGAGPRVSDFATFDDFWSSLCKRDMSIRMGDTASGGLGIDGSTPGNAGHADEPSQADNWGNFDLVYCRDGKARRIESGTFPLADGVPNRVGRLRGYGNAIVPQVAARFITAFIQILTGCALTEG